MKAWRFIFFPFALIYTAITAVRNGFYRVGIFKPSKFSLPIISVGNLSMGGTGKTPHTEYLIRLLQDQTKLFTLSRGFGRKERGFIIGDANSTANQIGDEPLQYQLKYGNKIGVAVDTNRVHGVMEICRHYPETSLVLLDDAYQHRAIYAGLSILITPFDDPFYTDYVVPIGRLREGRWGKNRADIIVVSKCPTFDQLNREEIIRKIKPAAHQTVFFSQIQYGEVVALKKSEETVELKGRKLIVVSGIANANPLIDFLGKENTILKHFNFPDHYHFKPADISTIHNLFDKFAREDALIITTEKDAMRLLEKSWNEETKNYPWFYQRIEVVMDNAAEFNKKVTQYVEKNS